MWACTEKTNSAGETIVGARKITKDMPLVGNEYVMYELPALETNEEHVKQDGEIVKRAKVMPTRTLAEKLALIGVTIDELATAVAKHNGGI